MLRRHGAPPACRRGYLRRSVKRDILTALFRLTLTLIIGMGSLAEAQLVGSQFRRVSRVSNFEFALFNDGMIWGTFDVNGYNTFAHWPRGSNHLYAGGEGQGIAFLARKNGRYLVSDADFARARDAFPNPSIIVGNQMCPGRIGDPLAGFDTTFQQAGWHYVDSPDYIVYSSLDYDSAGIDISGNNYNDWPLRYVNTQATYVTDPLVRRSYSPVFLSDEDMFLVVKDTDTRADQGYSGPGGPSIPIGLEVHQYVRTWGSGPAKDIVVFQYELFNKGVDPLDSCFVAFSPNLEITGITRLPRLRPRARIATYSPQPWRNLSYTQPQPWEWWDAYWTATPYPPTIGYPVLESPAGYDGVPLGLRKMFPLDTVATFLDSTGTLQRTFDIDSIMYRALTTPPPWPYPNPPPYNFRHEPLLLSGPFPMSVGQSVRFSVGFLFADSLPHLLLMDDYIKRVYASGFKRPVPPPPPRLTAKGLNRGVKLSWDTSSELAVDEIIPDSLGKPFRGYRLLRAVSEGGPFVQIGRWVEDTLLIYEFIDRGEDIGGLKNNVRYFYRLLAFDEGSPQLKLEPMESDAVTGVNALSVIPATDASNSTSSGGVGVLATGTLGDVGEPYFKPLNVTNFNTLLSGKAVTLSMSASTDGERYTMPVTVRDSVSGQIQNVILDPNLFVHGSPATAGIKEGILRIENIFALGASDIELPYRFEQLADSFHIEPPLIESSSDADTPVLVRDSINYTGIRTITPYTNSQRAVRVEFLPGGLDTIDRTAGMIFEYLNVRVVDSSIDSVYTPGRDYTFSSIGVKANGFFQRPMRNNHYYHIDTLANGDQWEFGHVLSMAGSIVAFDFPDRGIGSGRPGLPFPWGSAHRRGTRDFEIGDRVNIVWAGGVRAVFPRNAVVNLTGGAGGLEAVTNEMLDKIRIVPNPYVVRHEAQRDDRRIYFNYLPDECTIRIYTLALDLVKTIHHQGGSREEWDLTTELGQLVASQMLFAHIESAGKNTIKKFAVIVGK